MSVVTLETLSRLTGLPVDASQAALLFSDLPTLDYTEVSADDQAALIAKIAAEIDAGNFRIVGAGDDHSVWTKGWNEVASAVAKAPRITVESLKPQYYYTNVPLRILGGYIYPNTRYLEYYVSLAVRRQIMAHCFAGSRRLLELGCGTGINLWLASDLFPHAALAGTDWVHPTLDILACISRSIDRSIDGRILDFLIRERMGGRDDRR